MSHLNSVNGSGHSPHYRGSQSKGRGQACIAGPGSLPLGAKILDAKSSSCNAVVVGAGPYGLSAAAYLRAAGVETRVFGEPMSFWENQMPVGMCLRSNWGASHIADPRQALTLDEYCRQNGNHVSKPIPLDRFVDYGRWYQGTAVPDLDKRQVRSIEAWIAAFRVILADGEEFTHAAL